MALCTVVHKSSVKALFDILDGGKVKAIRYYKTTSKDDTATFEVWFSEKEHVPLRSVIGLNAQYGATIQVDLKKIPKL